MLRLKIAPVLRGVAKATPIVVVISLLFNYDNYKPQDNYTKNYTFRIIVLNTPDYDHIGCYGVNSLKKYAETHGYEFTQYREKLLPDLNINFTKNAITPS